MKAFKVNADTVAALISDSELRSSDKRSILSYAKSAFISLGETAPRRLEVMVYSKGGKLLIFAAKKKACFNVTAFYPKVM